MQTDSEIDAIRERMDARAMRAKYDDTPLSGDELDRQAHADRWAERDALLERRWKTVAEETESASEIRNLIDHALAEVLVTQKQYIGGTVDYTEAGGVLLEHMPAIILALRAVCPDEQEIVDLQERISNQKDAIKDLGHARAAAHCAAQTVGHALKILEHSQMTPGEVGHLMRLIEFRYRMPRESAYPS